MALYAIVPAAGLSRRMGQPKLVMTLGSRPVVRHLLDALSHSSILAAAIVYRRDDERLEQVLTDCDVISCRPEIDPPDMRASVEHGLTEIERRFAPSPDAGWLLIPADHPVVDPQIVQQLIESWNDCDADVLIPTFNGRRGHPTIFRWSLVEPIRKLPADCGLNTLVHDDTIVVMELPVDSDSILLDLDTPEDFDRLSRRFADK